MSSSFSPRRVTGLTVALLSAVFLIDLATPLGYAVPLLYSLPLLLTIWLPAWWSTIWIATAATMLTIIGYLLDPPGGHQMLGLMNRIMAVCAGWTLAWLILHFKAGHRNLLQSEGRFQRMFMDAAVPMAVLDRGKRFIQINRAFCDLVGYEAHELLGKTYALITHPNDLAGNFALTDQFLMGQIPRYNLEKRYRRKDGSLLWVSVRVSRISLPGHEHPLIYSVVQDITAQKQAQQALRTSEERYRAVVEGQTEVISRFRIDGTLTFVNDVYCRFFGKSVEELSGCRWQPVAHPEDLPRIQAELGVLSPSHPVVVIENRVYAAGGEIRWMQFVNRGLFDADSRLVEIQSVGRDITDRKQAEERLFRASALMKAVFESSPIGIATTDAEGCLTSWSPALERLFGWSEQEVLGRQSRIIPAGKESGADDLWERVMKGESLRGVEVRRCRKDGALVDVQIWGGALRDSAGEIVGTVGIVADIGARKEAEAALRESETRLDLTLRGANLGTWDWNVATGRVIFNERWAGMLGYALDEIEPHIRSWERLVHPNDLPVVMPVLTAHLQGKTDFYACEYRLRHESGQWIWVLDSGRVFERTAEGAPLRAAGVHLDITDRKQAEAALRESEERFRLAFEMAPTGMALSTPDGVFVRVNRRLCEMLGYPERELIGLSFAHVTYPEDVTRTRQGMAALTAGQISVYIDETRFLQSDGQVIWGVLTLSMIRDDAGISLYALAQVQDVTELRQAEAELRQAIEVRDRIGRDLHDGILQSLYAIGLRLESSRESMTARPRQGEALLDQAMQQLADVMGEVRQFIGGLDSVSGAPTDWADAARSLVESQAAIYRVNSEVSIDPEAVRSLSPQVGMHLINIIRESVSNSLRHGRPSHLTVQLTRDQRTTRLRIRDDGRGFRPMSVAKGGHGLRNMKARSDSLGADFQIVSELGVGTEVLVELHTEEAQTHVGIE